CASGEPTATATATTTSIGQAAIISLRRHLARRHATVSDPHARTCTSCERKSPYDRGSGGTITCNDRRAATAFSRATAAFIVRPSGSAIASLRVARGQWDEALHHD